MTLVQVHFHYATTNIGKVVSLWQRLRGKRNWRFSHVSFTLNGRRYDRQCGQTLIDYPVVSDPYPCVTLVVESLLPAETIQKRAIDYLLANGEKWFDCVRFVTHCVMYGRNYKLPATLFKAYAQAHNELLQSISDREHTARRARSARVS